MSILRVAHSRSVITLWAGFFGKTQAMLVHGQRSGRVARAEGTLRALHSLRGHLIRWHPVIASGYVFM